MQNSAVYAILFRYEAIKQSVYNRRFIMIQLHVTYTMKPGIHPKAFFDALNAANIPSLCRHEKGNIRYSFIFRLIMITSSFFLKYGKTTMHLQIISRHPTSCRFRPSKKNTLHTLIFSVLNSNKCVLQKNFNTD